jgi:hypothetical protein
MRYHAGAAQLFSSILGQPAHRPAAAERCRNCERSGQIPDSIRAAHFLGIYDRFLCADSRHVWQGVADAQEDLHDSNTLDGKFWVGMRLD